MNENIYQDRIIEWSKRTDHVAVLEKIHCSATASNPLCGDKISVEMELDGDLIKSIAYQVKGCVLCKASSAVFAEQARGWRFDYFNEISSILDGALRSSADAPAAFPEGFSMFSPVRLHKSRHSCVLLPFKAAEKAISQYMASVNKEA